MRAAAVIKACRSGHFEHPAVMIVGESAVWASGPSADDLADVVESGEFVVVKAWVDPMWGPMVTLKRVTS